MAKMGAQEGTRQGILGMARRERQSGFQRASRGGWRWGWHVLTPGRRAGRGSVATDDTGTHTQRQGTTGQLTAAKCQTDGWGRG